MRDDSIRDRCAVFGIWGVPKPAEYVYLALHNLQHRGQESSGIVTASKRKFHCHHGMGIVNDIFGDRLLAELNGRGAIGHNRYSTFGSSSLANAQPMVAETGNGPVAIAHNGQFANCTALKARLQREGCIFKSDSDTELILHYFARAREKTLEGIVASCFREVKPAYSIVMLTLKALVAVRDPCGVRPLVLGRLPASQGGAYAVASETTAFDIIGARYLGEVEPGEMIIADDGGLRRIRLCPPAEELRCVFEYIYFARPDSFLFGCERTTGEVRKAFGRRLAREHPAEADVVMPVPDSSTFAALGYSGESGIPFDFGLIRSHYIGRTFIEPSQSIRHFGVKLKLLPARSAIEGRRVIVIDDSIVRSTTMRKIVKMIHEAGAKEVHVRISSPPTVAPCFYGIDTPNKSELIAATHSIEEIRKQLCATSLAYLSIEGLITATGGTRHEFCHACFSEEYPIPVPGDGEAGGSCGK